jgi:DNA-binding MarR family transcriptional regulator
MVDHMDEDPFGPVGGPRHALIKDTVHRLFELTGRLRAHMDGAAASLDLTPMQARALFVTQAPIPMGALADALHCDASNITGIVDRLEERGLMERVMDPDDRRRRTLVVTDEGRAVTARLRELVAHDNPILRLDEADLGRLHDMLLQMLVPDAPIAHPVD